MAIPDKLRCKILVRMGTRTELLAAGSEQIVSGIRAWNSEKGSEVCIRYLRMFEPGEWDLLVLDRGMRPLLENPDGFGEVLGALPPRVGLEFKTKIIGACFDRAFADGRLRFWIKYIEQMSGIPVKKKLRNSSSAGIAWGFIFDQFCVVEFEPIGACYFYTRETFLRLMAIPTPADSSLKCVEHGLSRWLPKGRNSVFHRHPNWEPVLGEIVDTMLVAR